jgi:hypothetical protein
MEGCGVGGHDVVTLAGLPAVIDARLAVGAPTVSGSGGSRGRNKQQWMVAAAATTAAQDQRDTGRSIGNIAPTVVAAAPAAAAAGVVAAAATAAAASAAAAAGS